MSKNIGLFWLKDDFRIKKNLALAEATKNHDKVVVFYLYKNKKFEYQQAQKWWVAKSLDNFKKQLSNFNINLEVVEVSSYKQAFDQLLKKDFSIYWNKTYEPDYLKFDDYLSKTLSSKKIKLRFLKVIF